MLLKNKKRGYCILASKHFIKNSFIFIIFLSLILSIPNISFGEKHWADEEINYLIDKKVMQGYEDGSFKPGKDITRAEFIKVVNNTFGYTEKAKMPFSDVKESDWYYEDISKGVAAGYISGYDNGTMRPNKFISRQEAAKIISIAYEFSEESDITKFKDSKDIAPWAIGFVGAVNNKGIMTGYNDDTFRPNKNITRGEVAKIIAAASGDIYNEKGEYSKDAKGNVVVNTSDIILKNMTIEGDLYLAEGIGDGDVTLNNVRVKGNLRVKGGGEESIHIINSNIEKVHVNKRHGKVRVIIGGNSKVIKLDANVESTIIIGNGTVVDELKINKDAELIVEKGGVVKELEVNSKNTEIKVEGTIERLIAKENVKINGIVVEKGKEVKIIGNKIEEIGKEKPKEEKPKEEAKPPKDDDKPIPQPKYSFEAKLNKNEYKSDEDLTLLGTVLKDKIGLSNVDITLKLIKKDGTIPPITVEQLKTDNNGKFISIFKVPEGTEAGEYLLVVKANEPVDKSLKIDLKVLEDSASIYVFKAEIDKKEYTVDEDIILTGTVLKDKIGLANVDITLKLIDKEDNELPITVEQMKTDKDGKFTYTFKIPEGTNLGEYVLIVKANEPLDEKIECNLTISNIK